MSVDFVPRWGWDGVRVWQCGHVRGQRGEPQARVLLSSVLEVETQALPLQRSALGRPQLVGKFADMDVGWSHSGELLLVALGGQVCLGVDVERRRARPRMLEIAERFFHADEVSSLLALSGELQVVLFFRLWCAKEAVLKAHGQGISFGLHRLSFRDTPEGLHLQCCDPALGQASLWQLKEWEPEAGYCAALAWYPLALS